MGWFHPIKLSLPSEKDGQAHNDNWEFGNGVWLIKSSKLCPGLTWVSATQAKPDLCQDKQDGVLGDGALKGFFHVSRKDRAMGLSPFLPSIF